jgi:hypothetical protein
MTFTTRSWSSATVLLCTLLLQNCQSNSLKATQEEELATSPSPASAMRQRASSRYLAVQPSTSPSASLAAHGLPSRLSTAPSALATVGNSLAASYHLPAAAMPGASHAVPLGNAPGVLSPVFTTSSGECVSFSQVAGQWRAAMQAGDGSVALQRTLPVVGSEDIGALLSRLQHQGVWAARARIHVLAMPVPPYNPCVYLGKMGLLGGAPAQEEWRQGPTMILDSDAESKGTYHIPPGYRYKDYRLKAGSVIQRASLTINYVAAENEEEYRKLEAAQNAQAAAAGMGVNVGQVVTLGELKGNVGHVAFEGHEGLDLKRTKHAGLVLHGVTKKDSAFFPKSMIHIQVEILVERVEETLSQPAVVNATPLVPISVPGSTPQAPAQSVVPISVRPLVVAPAPQALCDYDAELEKAEGRKEEATRQKQLEALRKEQERRKEEEERQKRAEILRKEQERIEEAARQKQLEDLRKEQERRKEEEERQKQAEALRKEQERIEEAARQKQLEALRKEQERRKEEEERQKQLEALRKEQERREEKERQKQAEALRKEEECIEEAARQEQAQAASALLSKKLANPNHALSDQESIVLLTSCVSDGVENAKQVAGKEAVIVIGNTGAGKSTFVNYLLGCEMIEKTPEELEALGIEVLDDVVVVKSKSEGGRCDEIMPIGHSKTSKTFIPQIAVDPIHAHLAYCDCPGFLDNRGAEINIANAVNIKRVLQVAKSAKVLVLINYYSLKADRARGLTDMLNICAQLFGSTSNLSRFQDSLLLGITQAPANRDLNFLRKWLVKDTPEVMQVLSKRLFLYDPLNRGGSDFWGQAECASQIALLKGIPESESSHIFQTVLTAEDEQKLVEIVEKQSKTLSKELSRGAYSQAGACWQSLRRLSVIDNIRVERMLHFAQSRVQHVVTKRVATYRDYVVHYQFDEAERYLSALRAMSSHFATASLELDLDELVRHRAYFEKKQAAEVKQQQEYREAQALYAADTKRLLGIIEEQKQAMESRLSALFSEHAQETSRLHFDMIRRGEEYDAQIAKLREENSASLRQQAERKALSEALSAEERAKLQETQAQLQRDYEAKLAEAEREKAQFRSEYEALLAQQEEAQAQSRQALQAQIAQLSAQEATKKAELAKTAIPAMAFGPQEWSRYYGEVGAAPPLPTDIEATLNASCPFWPDKKVRDTHLLVLLPATVNGKPFTLNLLSKLIKGPKRRSGGHGTKYRYYSDATKAQIGNNSPDRSYWLLITRDVLPESRNKTYAAQKELVAGHANRTGFPYELPKALEAATAILTHYVRNGERLYGTDPRTETRCQELIREYPAVVGAFDSSGLFVNFNNYDRNDVGVAGFRKF